MDGGAPRVKPLVRAAALLARAEPEDEFGGVPPAAPTRPTIPMLETFTLDTFRPHVGELFRVIVDEQWELHLVLTEVSAWGEKSARGGDRAPFSLVFHAPTGGVIPQAIYRIENASMEPMELFLAPIEPDGGGMRYEAVFT